MDDRLGEAPPVDDRLGEAPPMDGRLVNVLPVDARTLLLVFDGLEEVFLGCWLKSSFLSLHSHYGC